MRIDIIPLCADSWKLPGGGVFSRRGTMGSQAWLAESKLVSDHLLIPWESNPGRFSEQYAVRVFDRPYRGILCSRLIIWLRMTIEMGVLHPVLFFADLEKPAINVPGMIYWGGKAAWAEAMEKFPTDHLGQRDNWYAQRRDELMAEWWAKGLKLLFGPMGRAVAGSAAGSAVASMGMMGDGA